MGVSDATAQRKLTESVFLSMFKIIKRSNTCSLGLKWCIVTSGEWYYSPMNGKPCSLSRMNTSAQV